MDVNHSFADGSARSSERRRRGRSRPCGAPPPTGSSRRSRRRRRCPSSSRRAWCCPARTAETRARVRAAQSRATARVAVSIIATSCVPPWVEAANRPSGDTAMRPAPLPPVAITCSTASVLPSSTVTLPSPSSCSHTSPLVRNATPDRTALHRHDLEDAIGLRVDHDNAIVVAMRVVELAGAGLDGQVMAALQQQVDLPQHPAARARRSPRRLARRRSRARRIPCRRLR